MHCVTKKRIKTAVIILLAIIGAFVLTVLGYVIYVLCQYSRIEDNLTLSVDNQSQQIFEENGEYSITTYNIGFGAYSPEFSFFMDTGVMSDGTKTRGKYGKGISKEDVQKNTDGSIAEIKKLNSDFVFLQEVDEKASRSYKINQLQAVRSIADYASVYACNFHSAYLFYPFNDPHGASNAGLVTMSKYKIDAALRRAYPISGGFSKFLDLDRALSVSTINLSSGKQLLLINSHMSAYDEGGVIRAAQLEFLNSLMKAEYDKGNYVIVGGDFNHDIAESIEMFESQQKRPEWVFELKDEDLPQGFSIAAATNAPTCRGADIPYEKGVNHTVVIDGFIVSDNVDVKSVINIDLDFAYSDHNPVNMVFSLKA